MNSRTDQFRPVQNVTQECHSMEINPLQPSLLPPGLHNTEVVVVVEGHMTLSRLHLRSFTLGIQLTLSAGICNCNTDVVLRFSKQRNPFF